MAFSIHDSGIDSREMWLWFIISALEFVSIEELEEDVASELE